MKRNLIQPCGGGFFKVITLAFAMFLALSVALCAPGYALAQEEQDSAQTEVYLSPSKDGAATSDDGTSDTTSKGTSSGSTTSVTNSSLSKTDDATPFLPLALACVSAAAVLGVAAYKTKAFQQTMGGDNK